jgi:hypothetical protein
MADIVKALIIMALHYNRVNLRKHEVLRSPLTITVDLEPSLKGNDRVMWIGFTFNLRLLEIGVEYLPVDQEYVFHAMEATKRSRQNFEHRTGLS